MGASGLNLGQTHDRSTARLHRERASGDDVTLDFNAHIRGDRASLYRPARGRRSRLPRRDGAALRRSYPGRRVVKPVGPKAPRAKQEIDYGRRGKGYVFGAFRPATGDALTIAYGAAPPRTGSISSTSSRL